MKQNPAPSVTAVILAGGQARRMGGVDKGLVPFRHQALVRYAIQALAPQVDELIINANRNQRSYAEFGFPVISDSISGYQGPLAGMLTAMQSSKSDYILTAPCDSPFIPACLRQRMLETLLVNNAEIAVATDGERWQPVFCLIATHLKDSLQQFLESGERKIDIWLKQHHCVEVNFADLPDTFVNFNHADDLAAREYQIQSSVPLLGFAAFSGTGKTTLLTQLIPELRRRGCEIAVIKHAHHLFDIDKPGKDSYQLREAGATQMLIASSRMSALMDTRAIASEEPRLADLLPRIDSRDLDIILVEGFKHEAIPKIELHRPSLGHPLLHEQDDAIIAIASDEIMAANSEQLTQLDLNDVNAIADFIQQYIKDWNSNHG